jgi:protocatechuate 3,4-dioxygenase beta subunit
MRPAIAMAALLLAACQQAPANTSDVTSAPAPAPGATRANLYQCEGCEAAFETDTAALRNTARIGPGIDQGPALAIDGVVYQSDGKTPAAGVIVYAYQTNAEGRYANGSPETVWSRRHGRLRGWVKTGQDGRYHFDTIKPAPYPNDTIPAHIHITVLEPGKRPYWIDDIVFDGAYGVTPAYRKSMVNQGGNGIVPLRRDANGNASVLRDIILERHPT